MMKQEIKCYQITEIDTFFEIKEDLLDRNNAMIELDIGGVDDEGTSIFSVKLYTSTGFIERAKRILKNENSRFIVLPYLDPKLILDVIQSTVDYCNQFDDPVLHLRKYFDWEYENYQYISQDALDENPMPENKEKLASWLDKQIDRAVKPGK